MWNAGLMDGSGPKAEWLEKKAEFAEKGHIVLDDAQFAGQDPEHVDDLTEEVRQEETKELIREAPKIFRRQAEEARRSEKARAEAARRPKLFTQTNPHRVEEGKPRYPNRKPMMVHIGMPFAKGKSVSLQHISAVRIAEKVASVSEGGDREPIVAFHCGYDDEVVSLEVLMDTGCRVERKVKGRVMRQSALDRIKKSCPEAAVEVGSGSWRGGFVYADGHSSGGYRCALYEVALRAVDSRSGRSRTAVMSIAVVPDKLLDYDMIVGFDSYIDDFDPKFRSEGEHTAKFRVGPFKGMVVKALRTGEGVSSISDKLGACTQRAREHVSIPPKSDTDVQLDWRTLETQLPDDGDYLVRLGNLAGGQGIMAEDGIISRQVIDRMKNGLLPGLKLRLTNPNPTARKVVLQDLFKLEKIEGDGVISLRGYVIGKPKFNCFDKEALKSRKEMQKDLEEVDKVEHSSVQDWVHHKWVQGATTERERKERLAALTEVDKASSERLAAMRKSEATADDGYSKERDKLFEKARELAADIDRLWREDKVVFIDKLIEVGPEALASVSQQGFDLALAKLSSQVDLEGLQQVLETSRQESLAAVSKNSYKTVQKKDELFDQGALERLNAEFDIKRKKALEEKEIDIYGHDWCKKVADEMVSRMDPSIRDSFKEQLWQEFYNNGCCYHEEGCPAPVLKDELARVEKKPDAHFKIIPNYKLSKLDLIRLEFIVAEEVRKGNLTRWEPGMELPLHGSPAFIAPRKGHESGRVVVDFRYYNKQVVNPVYNIPNTEDILQDMSAGDAEYFGAADLATGYFQASLHPDERQYLAITTPFGVYLPKRLQLGPSWAPSWFQSRSRAAFPFNFHVYIDDIVWKCKAIEEALTTIRQIHESCRKSGFVLSLKKTHVGVKEVEVLGHTINTQGRCVAPKKLDLVQNWQIKSAQDLKSFTCVLVYLREYIWKFQEKVAPLKQYMSSKNPKSFEEFDKDELAQKSVQMLKDSLLRGATIQFLDHEAACNYKESGRPAMVYVDASKYGKSFVICQRPAFGKPPKICVYRAKSYGAAERQWSTLERELDAVVYFMEEGSRFIENVPVVMLFDHKNLGFKELGSIWSNKIKSEKIGRWCDRVLERISHLKLVRAYLPGPLNILADAGSRIGFMPVDAKHVSDLQIPDSVQSVVEALFGLKGTTEAKDLEDLLDKHESGSSVKKSQVGAINEAWEDASDAANMGTLGSYRLGLQNFDCSSWRDKDHQRIAVINGGPAAVVHPTVNLLYGCTWDGGKKAWLGKIHRPKVPGELDPTKRVTFQRFKTVLRKDASGEWAPISGVTSEGMKELAMKVTREEVNKRFFQECDEEEELWVQVWTDGGSYGHPRWNTRKFAVGPFSELSLRGEYTYDREVWSDNYQFEVYIKQMPAQVANQADQGIEIEGNDPMGADDHLGDPGLVDHQDQDRVEHQDPQGLNEDLHDGGIDLQLGDDDEHLFIDELQIDPGLDVPLDDNEELPGLDEADLADQVAFDEAPDPAEPARESPEVGQFTVAARVEVLELLRAFCWKVPEGPVLLKRSQVVEVPESALPDGGVLAIQDNLAPVAELPDDVDPDLVDQVMQDQEDMDILQEEPDVNQVFSDAEVVEVFKGLSDLPAEEEDLYDEAMIFHRSSDYIYIDPSRGPGARCLVFYRTRGGQLDRVLGYPCVFSFTGKSLSIEEHISRHQERRGKEWYFDGAIIYTKARSPVSGSDPSFYGEDEDTQARWIAEQGKCEDCKWKKWFLSADGTEVAKFATLSRKLGAKRFRVEEMQLSRGHWKLWQGIVYHNGMRVVPRTKTETIYGLESEEAKVSTWLRTYFVTMSHTRGKHDHQLSVVHLRRFGVTWRDVVKDMSHYEANCLMCLAEHGELRFRHQANEYYANINEAWFMDLQGPFGFDEKYILSVIDDASGYGWLRLLDFKSDVWVIRGMKSIFDEAKLVSWPKRIRSDNGFGLNFTSWVQRKTNGGFRGPTEHREGTAENPQSQHRIERPRKIFRKWAVFDVRIAEEAELTREMVMAFESNWRERPVHMNFQHSPVELYFGVPDPGCQTMAESISSRMSSRKDLLQQFAALRVESSHRSLCRHLRGYGLCKAENEAKEGDFCLLINSKAKRKSKAEFTSNFRWQIFKVTRRCGTRAWLRAALEDAPIRFKLPVHCRNLIKVNPEYGDRLEF